MSTRYFLISEAGRQIMSDDRIEPLMLRIRSLSNAKIVDQNGTEVYPTDRRTEGKE